MGKIRGKPKGVNLFGALAQGCDHAAGEVPGTSVRRAGRLGRAGARRAQNVQSSAVAGLMDTPVTETAVPL